MLRFIIAVTVLIAPIAVADDPLIIDHTCTDLESVPLDVIEQIKSPDNVFHYAHRSHGWQPVEGLIYIESTYGNTYNFDREYCGMPEDPTALGMWDGMIDGDYVSPEYYWFSADGMNDVRGILTNNPEIRYSMWSWCGEHAWWPLEDIQAYLDSLDQLNNEFENVTFVYMTGHAEYSDYDPWGSLMRWERGNMIRDYCIENDKVLFDFEDMDCWYEGEQHVVTLELDSTYVIPAQHPAYQGNEVAHTTMENCINKGKAFWYMMARLRGWDPDSTSSYNENPSEFPSRLIVSENYPNPFSAGTTISFSINEPAVVGLSIFDCHGRLISELIHDTRLPGNHDVYWNGRDDNGNVVSSGTYLYRLQCSDLSVMKPFTILR